MKWVELWLELNLLVLVFAWYRSTRRPEGENE